ncbi:hypothetical protein EYF80_021724 [Liparis tanakae]|uniref:Uncharacterized protein n=1 Tax=Liparis tanakae TaxID=230148 RepID=A0A4Z2HQG3_9TELE|nr:hypothetical protein EYF80_021724 [Liparis tanakae]
MIQVDSWQRKELHLLRLLSRRPPPLVTQRPPFGPYRLRLAITHCEPGARREGTDLGCQINQIIIIIIIIIMIIIIIIIMIIIMISRTSPSSDYYDMYVMSYWRTGSPPRAGAPYFTPRAFPLAAGNVPLSTPVPPPGKFSKSIPSESLAKYSFMNSFTYED